MYEIPVLMSFSRLEKYLRDNPVVLPSGTYDRHVIVVSDSKGIYLQKQIQNNRPENNIIWQGVGDRVLIRNVGFMGPAQAGGQMG